MTTDEMDAKLERIRRMVESEVLREVFIDESEPIPTFEAVIAALSTDTTTSEWVETLPYIAEAFDEFNNGDLKTYFMSRVTEQLAFARRCFAA